MSASIFALLDDVVALTKAAAGKTAGVVGDDMAAGAQSMVGISPDRELPVVWAVAKGSLVNKALLIVGALLLSSFAAALIPLLLSAGGLFLVYEGAEKCLALMGFGHHGEEGESEASEAEKISGAIRTDLVLSAEIIVLSLAFVTGKPLPIQVAVLLTVGVALTVCVYGTVAFLIKLDDMGAWLAERPARVLKAIGRAILASVPYLLQALTVGGAIAMILVGGSVLLHNLPEVAESAGLGDGMRHGVHGFLSLLENLPLGGMLADFLAGWIAAGCAMAARAAGQRAKTGWKKVSALFSA